MSSHRETCIHRLAELADDDALRGAIVFALSVHLDTTILSHTVQHVLELRDDLVDAQGREETIRDLDGNPVRH